MWSVILFLIGVVLGFAICAIVTAPIEEKEEKPVPDILEQMSKAPASGSPMARILSGKMKIPETRRPDIEEEEPSIKRGNR